jgi:hypothetical protein
MSRACSTNGAKRNAYRILVGKPEGKRPLGKPRRRWVNYIKMNLRDMMGWYGLGQSGLVLRASGGALVNTVMNVQVP